MLTTPELVKVRASCCWWFLDYGGKYLYWAKERKKIICDETFTVGWLKLASDNRRYYSTHCNTAHIWSWCAEYLSFEVNRYPAIYVISCVGEKNGKIKIVSSFSAKELCFVINVLNNKTIILLNLTEYPLILATSAKYSARFYTY